LTFHTKMIKNNLRTCSHPREDGDPNKGRRPYHL
jgi:hypothetical protein